MATNNEIVNIKFIRGDTGEHIFEFVDGEGDPYSLVGYAIRCQARKSAESSTIYFDIVIEDGDHESDFSIGKIVLLVPSEVTTTMPPTCPYDIQASSGSRIKTIVRGNILLLADITR